jgi:hypothetical protein
MLIEPAVTFILSLILSITFVSGEFTQLSITFLSGEFAGISFVSGDVSRELIPVGSMLSILWSPQK